MLHYHTISRGSLSHGEILAREDDCADFLRLAPSRAYRYDSTETYRVQSVELCTMTFAGIRGLRHLALNVTDIRSSQTFYEHVFGMRVVWQPDASSVYLSSGADNLALHQIPADQLTAYRPESMQRLDHFGFLMDSPESVDVLFRRVETDGIPIVKPPKRHRDGSYSFYLADPDNNTIQVLFEPNVSRIL